MKLHHMNPTEMEKGHVYVLFLQNPSRPVGGRIAQQEITQKIKTRNRL